MNNKMHTSFAAHSPASVVMDGKAVHTPIAWHFEPLTRRQRARSLTAGRPPALILISATEPESFHWITLAASFVPDHPPTLPPPKPGQTGSQLNNIIMRECAAELRQTHTFNIILHSNRFHANSPPTHWYICHLLHSSVLPYLLSLQPSARW